MSVDRNRVDRSGNDNSGERKAKCVILFDKALNWNRKK